LFLLVETFGKQRARRLNTTKFILRKRVTHTPPSILFSTASFPSPTPLPSSSLTDMTLKEQEEEEEEQTLWIDQVYRLVSME
jgi:hypothetical protein